MQPWPPTTPGVVQLPSGRLGRGRALHRSDPGRGDRAGADPDFGLYLLGRRPPVMRWPSRWLRWPDWWLPLDRADARDALVELWHRARDERVEVACSGGQGRTGTALACLAVLDGIPPADAVGYLRQHYRSRAVETPWQRRYVHHFQS